MSDVVDSCLKLLQALNDEDSKSISESIKSKNVKTWIDNKVAVKRIKNPRIKFSNDFEYDTCLAYASWQNDVGTVRQLVQAGADVTVAGSYGSIPLQVACLSKTDAKEKVEFLLQRNESLITSRDRINDTPLHSAARGGNDDVISLLIEHGAQVDERGQAGRTPLHTASSRGHTACIDVLVANGADIEARDRKLHSSPLHVAAFFNRLNCVKTLIEDHGASINSKNKFNQTPLRDAAWAGHLNVVKQLTSYLECDIGNKDGNGKTAADMAREKGHKKVVSFLESLPARGPATVASVTSAMAASNITDASAAVSVTSAMAASNITDDRKGYKVVSEKILRKIARKAGAKRVDLGLELDLEFAVVETLQCKYSDPIDHAFHILMTWREMTGNKSEKEQVDMLEEALREIGRNDLQSYIGR